MNAPPQPPAPVVKLVFISMKFNIHAFPAIRTSTQINSNTTQDQTMVVGYADYALLPLQIVLHVMEIKTTAINVKRVIISTQTENAQNALILQNSLTATPLPVFPVVIY